MVYNYKPTLGVVASLEGRLRITVLVKIHGGLSDESDKLFFISQLEYVWA